MQRLIGSLAQQSAGRYLLGRRSPQVNARYEDYLYEIRSYGVSSFDDISDWNVFDVEKYGISSDNGYRVKRQVDVLNRANDGRVYSYIIRHNAIPGRFEALILEKFYVTHYAATHGGQVPRLQVKPIPW